MSSSFMSAPAPHVRMAAFQIATIVFVSWQTLKGDSRREIKESTYGAPGVPREFGWVSTSCIAQEIVSFFFTLRDRDNERTLFCLATRRFDLRLSK